MVFEVLGTSFSDRCSSLYSQFLPSPWTWKSPSQLEKNFPSIFQVSLRSLHIISYWWNALGLTLELYILVVLSLHGSSLIRALSQSLFTMSRLVARLSLFKLRSNNCFLREDSPTSTGIMVLVPYVNLYGVSCAANCKVHRYAHKISTSSSVHLPIVGLSRFFSLFKMTLFVVLT